MTTTNAHQLLIPHLFRSEYAKMTAVLCRHFGLQYIEIAEDIASDTFLKASELWPVNGIPDNPVGWLYTVAKNATRDYLRRNQIFEQQISPELRQQLSISEISDQTFTPQIISDSQLSMLFTICLPTIPQPAQICLALQILCGFSVEEIAQAFLSKPETIKKRLFRGRQQLRQLDFQAITLQTEDLQSRRDAVMTTIYLLFNEGYFSRTGKQLVREELCGEALRLALLLDEHPATTSSDVKALIALLCYQSSRLEARIDARGEAVLFEDQNREAWNQELIDRGNLYLVTACSGSDYSVYHLQACIAYWHAAPLHPKKWEHILRLYDQLTELTDSPIAAMNRTYAYAQVHGAEKALKTVQLLSLPTDDAMYQALLGYLYTAEDQNNAVLHYREAIRLSKSAIEKQALKNVLSRLLAEEYPN